MSDRSRIHGLDSTDAQIRPVATAFLRQRPWIVAPFFAFAVVTFVLGGARSEQIVALSAAGTLAVSFFFYERWRGRRRLVDSASFRQSLLFTVAGIAFACAVTGGMTSPLVPMLFAPCGVGFAAFGRARASTVLFAALAVVVVGLTALSPALTSFAVPEAPRRAVLAAAVVCAAVLLRVGVGGLTSAHARAAEALATAGEEIVRASQARTREMETLGARVAHEMKNPLAAVRALVELLLESADERSKKRLTVAASEVQRMETIIEGYASASHPLDTVLPRRVDVAEMVSSLVAVLEPRAERAGVELSVDSASRAHVTFALDRDRTKEALLNLVINALDATPIGGTVVVSWAVLGDGALELRVTDTGRGMTRETRAKIGTPFFTRREGGTGLGVAHARRVAERHGGRLDYESEEGGGTTAIVTLPSSPIPTDADRSDL